MNFSRVWAVMKKDLIETARDRRALFTMLAVPLISFPILGSLAEGLVVPKPLDEGGRAPTVALVGEEFAPGLVAALAEDTLLQLRRDLDLESAVALARSGDLDAVLAVPSNFATRIQGRRTAQLTLYYRSLLGFGGMERVVRERVELYDRSVVYQRLQEAGLGWDQMDAVDVTTVDLLPRGELLGALIALALPYLIVFFMFTGAMYVGIDISTGEKERKTLETLLASPASRPEIVTGKFLVVMTMGLASVGAAIGGGVLTGAVYAPRMPPEVLQAAGSLLNAEALLLLLALVIPIAGLVAAAILLLAVGAGSVREAQARMLPLYMLLGALAIASTAPGLQLTPYTALVPVTNVGLATRQIVSGDVEWVPLATAYLSLFLLAGVSLWLCVRWFEREDTILGR